MNRYVVVVEFLSTENGDIFYMAHIFTIQSFPPVPTQTYQLSVSAFSPEEAYSRAMELMWLLNL